MLETMLQDWYQLNDLIHALGVSSATHVWLGVLQHCTQKQPSQQIFRSASIEGCHNEAQVTFLHLRQVPAYMQLATGLVCKSGTLQSELQLLCLCLR